MFLIVFDDFSENINSSNSIQSDYDFPSFNFSAFIEHIFNLNNKLSLTPGFRFEHISTSSDGVFRRQELDNANNIIFDSIYSENDKQSREFIILGLGVNYKLKEKILTDDEIEEDLKKIIELSKKFHPNMKINIIPHLNLKLKSTKQYIKKRDELVKLLDKLCVYLNL
jgi:thiamine kinase-like enzyme